MPIVCGVSFRNNNKAYHFEVREGLDLQLDDYVIVDTARGQELGRVVQAPREMERRDVVELAGVGLATTAELLEAERLRLQETRLWPVPRARGRLWFADEGGERRVQL